MTVSVWKQKRALYKTTFEFGDEELTYTFDNSRAKAGGTVAYHKIPGRMTYREIKLWWVKYAFVSYAVLCLIAGFSYGSVEGWEALPGTAVMALPAFVFIAVLLMRKPTALTAISVNPVLFIIHDSRHQAILDEIMKRRAEMMKKKLAQVDFNTPYYEETRKFNWLKEEGIITEPEYRHARQKISVMRDKAGLSSPPSGGMN